MTEEQFALEGGVCLKTVLAHKYAEPLEVQITVEFGGELTVVTPHIACAATVRLQLQMKPALRQSLDAILQASIVCVCTDLQNIFKDMVMLFI